MKFLLQTFLFILLAQTSLLAGLSAVGYAENEKKAKESALTELANQVSAKVDSEFKSSTTVTNQKLDKSVKNDLKVSSNVYFQGVTYSNAVQTQSGYEITAELSDQAIEDTLAFLQKELHKDMSGLSKRALKKLLSKAEIAYALANFSISKEDIQEDIKVQEALVQKYLTFGQVTFNIKPSTAVVMVNDEPYELFKTYLLASTKKYNFEIQAEGYYTEEGTLSFGKGEKRTIAKQLIKKSDEGAKVYVDVKSDIGEFQDTVSGILLSYGVGITPSSTATNSIRFTFDKQFITEVSGMKVYKVTVQMSAYKGSDKIMQKKVKLKNVVDSNYITKVNKGVKALTKYLLKKQDMKAFIGKDTINYDDI